MNPTHTTTRDIVFGDCDPAGIVYYPNIYAWMDGTFHHYLLPLGGHQVVCAAVGSVGFGLFQTQARYARALRIGDRLSIEMRIVEWARKTVTIAYRGVVEEHVAFEGTETRGFFEMRDGRMRAGEIAPLKALLEREAAS